MVFNPDILGCSLGCFLSWVELPAGVKRHQLVWVDIPKWQNIVNPNCCLCRLNVLKLNWDHLRHLQQLWLFWENSCPINLLKSLQNFNSCETQTTKLRTLHILVRPSLRPSTVTVMWDATINLIFGWKMRASLLTQGQIAQSFIHLSFWNSWCGTNMGN